MKKLKIKNHSKEHLKELGFSFNRQMSGDDCEFYSLSFPVLKHKKPVVVGKITIECNSGEIREDCIDLNSNTMYRPFYYSEPAYVDIKRKILKEFSKIHKKIGIVRK